MGSEGTIMLRRVIKVENYVDPHANGTQGSNILTLECGHWKRQKGSIKIPVRCRCRECDYIESGATLTLENATFEAT